MVKKLFKHEFLAYARVMTIVYIILLTVSAVGRIIQLFENDSMAYTIVSVIANATYGVSIAAAIFFGLIFTLVRFYKNLFSFEGYLSFTLPVTPSQHIWAKSITALSFNVITAIIILLSGFIITAGDMLTEIFKALAYILKKLFEIASYHTVIVAAEFFVLLLVASFTSILLYYTFISIGQLFKKNRVFAAVGAYFVYYIVTQVVSTIFLIVVTALADTSVFEELAQFIELHPYAAIHIALCSFAVLLGIFAVICFIVIKIIITKKLNLE